MDVREVVCSDAPALFELLTDPEVTRHLSPPPMTIEAFEGFIAWAQRERSRGTAVCFGIVPHGLGQAVGIIQVRALEPAFFTAEWGFALGTAFWGTGVFHEAVDLVARFAFETINVHRLEARAVTANARGNGALQKIGARTEAVLTGAFRREGRTENQLLWSLMAEDWRQARVERPRFCAAAARESVQRAIAEVREQVNEPRARPSKTPPLYPFFLTDTDRE